MKSVRLDYPLGLLCRVFGVSRSGFYAAVERPLSRRAQDDERLKVAIKAAHVQTRKTYGPLRLQPELVAQGFDTGRDRIARLRQELGLRCKQKRKFKATTNDQMVVFPFTREQGSSCCSPSIRRNLCPALALPECKQTSLGRFGYTSN